MTWGVVMMKHLFVSIIWFHANDPFSQPFKDIFMKNLVNSMSRRNKFFVDDSPMSKKQISIDMIFDLLILAFFGRGEFVVCHFLLCLLVSES